VLGWSYGGGRFLMSEVPLYSGCRSASGVHEYRGASPISNCAPPQDRHRALGTVLLQGPRGRTFLISEVPL